MTDSKALAIPETSRTEAIGKGKAIFKPQGLRLTGSYTALDLQALIGRLAQFNNTSKIWLGDAIVAGENKFGEEAAQAMAVTGLEYGTIANYASIARLVPFKVRPEATLPMRTLAAVAPLSSYPNAKHMQSNILARAVAGGLTSEEVRILAYEQRVACELQAAKLAPEITESIQSKAVANNWSMDQLRAEISGGLRGGSAKDIDEPDGIAILSPQEALEAGYGAESGTNYADGEIRTLRANLAILAGKWELAAENTDNPDEIEALLTCAANLRVAIGFETDNDGLPGSLESVSILDSIYTTTEKTESTPLAAEQEIQPLNFASAVEAELDDFANHASEPILALVDTETGEVVGEQPRPKSKTPYPKKYRDAIFDELASICKLDKRVHSGRLGKATTQILDMGYNAEHVKAFMPWWKISHWKGKKGSHPNPTEVVDNLIAANETGKQADGSRFLAGKFANELKR